MNLIIRILLLLTLCANYVSAHEPHLEPRLIEVQGTAKKKVTPDMAICSFSVISEAKTAEEARSKNELNAKNVLNAIRKMGITEAEINLERFNIEEDQEYNQKEQKYILKGYKAVRAFSVEVFNLDSLPKVIATVTQNGTNSLNRVSYTLKNPEQYRLPLLKEAVLNAKAKAETMLIPVTAKLGLVHRLSESSSFDYPSPRAMPMMLMAKAANAESDSGSVEAYSAGTVEITVNVQASFNIL
jgi:uncharacterized protein